MGIINNKISILEFFDMSLTMSTWSPVGHQGASGNCASVTHRQRKKRGGGDGRRQQERKKGRTVGGGFPNVGTERLVILAEFSGLTGEKNRGGKEVLVWRNGR